MKVLAIESSCDETAVSIVEDGRKVISNLVFSQIYKHQKWGGVIPELASRLHLEVIHDLIDKALMETNLSWDNIDSIAVTENPGLQGSLLVGLNVAKTLAWIHSKTLIPVNHLHGHVCANFLDSNLEPPFICMLASGGHTQIISMKSYTEMEILGETIDDAAGEAFDKVARLMGLAYPGGPHLDKLAQTVTDTNVSEAHSDSSIINGRYHFPIAKVDALNFSFSGLKTAVLRLKEKTSAEIWEKDKAKIAKAFQDCISKTFVTKIEAACKQTGIKQVVLAGGVSANSAIRSMFQEKFSQEPYRLIIPALKYCTDNAAMIGSAGYYNLTIS